MVRVSGIPQPAFRRRTFTGAVVLASLALTAGCSGAESDEAGGSCPRMVKFDGRTYLGARDGLSFKTGDQLGSARQEPCNDIGGRSPAATEMPKLGVYRVVGIDQKLAVGVGDTVQDVRLYAVRDGKKVPREVVEFMERSLRTKQPDG
ncbi:DUF6281 family protein [Streptomyces sp. NPDC052236]|uniref:DUF6281 family protein n=1 Tax=Streptomyces sp. NPDC052236 TaxID=3365686 RepID=UPI0037D4BB32